MKLPVSIVVFAVLIPHLLRGQAVQDSDKTGAPSASLNFLSRHYQEGEKLSYHIKGTNKGKTGTESYEADAIGAVKQDSKGRFFEEYQWTNLILNTKKID